MRQFRDKVKASTGLGRNGDGVARTDRILREPVMKIIIKVVLLKIEL